MTCDPPPSHQVLKHLIEESPSLRSTLLKVRLNTHTALGGLQGSFTHSLEIAAQEHYDIVCSEYIGVLYNIIVDWAGGKADLARQGSHRH